MIGWIRFVVESEFRVAPVEFSRIYNSSADGRTMSSYPLCKRMDNNICAMVNGAEYIGGGKCGIHSQGNMVFLGQVGKARNINHIQGRIPDGLGEDQPGPVCDG